MTITKLWTPIKREFWEYKVGLLWTPAAVALLLVLSVLYVAIAYGYDAINIYSGNLQAIESGEHYSHEFRAHMDNLDWGGNIKDMIICYFSVAAIVLMAVPVAIVLLVYGHSALFDDRRNREILFWRSLPVSETQNVLTKLLVMGVIAPSVIFVLTLASVAAVVLMDLVLSIFVEHWQPASIAMSFWWPVKLYGIMLFYFVMLFPFYAWMLFSSALAKKSPFMVSSLIPVLLIVIDRMAVKYMAVDLHIVSGLNRYIDFLDDVTAKNNLAFTVDLAASFAVAMSIGGLLVMASIWLRNNRYEI